MRKLMFFRQAFLVFLFFLILTLFYFPSLASGEKSATQGAQAKVDYTLPYPGILPGNPLYILKTMRDRIMGWFITDPLKKAEFNLLMADKQLNSGIFLLDKGQGELAQAAFSKGEEYLIEALNEAEKARKQGKDINVLISKLSLATLKHQEVLTEVLGRVPESARGGIQNALENSKKGIERIREGQTQKLEQRIKERSLSSRFNRIQVEAKEKNGK